MKKLKASAIPSSAKNLSSAPSITGEMLRYAQHDRRGLFHRFQAVPRSNKTSIAHRNETVGKNGTGETVFFIVRFFRNLRLPSMHDVINYLRLSPDCFQDYSFMLFSGGGFIDRPSCL